VYPLAPIFYLAGQVFAPSPLCGVASLYRGYVLLVSIPSRKYPPVLAFPPARPPWPSSVLFLQKRRGSLSVTVSVRFPTSPQCKKGPNKTWSTPKPHFRRVKLGFAHSYRTNLPFLFPYRPPSAGVFSTSLFRLNFLTATHDRPKRHSFLLDNLLHLLGQLNSSLHLDGGRAS